MTLVLFLNLGVLSILSYPCNGSFRAGRLLGYTVNLLRKLSATYGASECYRN